MESFKSRRIRFWAALAAFLLLTAALGGSRLQAQAGLPALVLHYADIVLYNGKILTVDPTFSIVEAVAIRDGKFLAVGTTQQILPLAGPQTRQIDLKGKTVTPGIVDTHQHPFSEGLIAYFQSKYPTSQPVIGIQTWKDANDAYQDIAKLAEEAKPGDPIIMTSRLQLLCSNATLAPLDAISPNNPVIFIQPANVWPDAINSQAASLVRPFVEGPIYRKEGSPCLTIKAREAVSSYFYSRIPYQDLLDIGRRGTQLTSKFGVTTAKEHTAPPLITIVREMWARGELTVRMRMPFPFYPLTGNQSVIPPKDAEKLFMYSGNLSGIGDDMFRLTGIRPSAVGGTIMTGTAWTIEPKKQELVGMKERPYGLGSGQYDPDIGDYAPVEGESFPGRTTLIQAIRYGWDVATDHTIGDRSVEEVLKAEKEALQELVVHRPGQIIAMGHTPFATPEQIREMKELGIRVGIGPFHLFNPWPLEMGFIQYGTDRLNKMEPYRTFLEVGLRPSLEGDMMGPPFWKAQAAITRKDEKYGRVWNAQQTVTREQALRMCTNNGAYQLGEEDKIGSIEPGKLGDLIVIDRDYLTMPEDQIAKINVLMTVVGGKVVYEVEGAI